MNWTGPLTVLVKIRAENCATASRSIHAFWQQDWADRQLFIINASNFVYGNSGYVEFKASDADDPAVYASVVAACKGEFIVDCEPDVLLPPSALTLLSKVVQHSMVIHGHLAGRLVFKCRSRTWREAQNLPVVRLDLDALPPTEGSGPVVAPELPVDDGRLNLLCPAGVGDLLWILAKLAPCSWDRNAVFWLPDGEQHRAGAVARMAGVRYGYLPGLTTGWVWEQPGSPELPKSGWVAVQANRHLEAGKPLHQWYPELPTSYPDLSPLFQSRQGAKSYVVVFTCVESYMGGQLQPHVWANIVAHLEKTVGPVMLVGAGADVVFCRKVESYYRPKVPPSYDRPLEEVAVILTRAKLVVGVASGLLIMSIAYGTPSIISYPRHLSLMPGTWEPDSSVRLSVFQDELQREVLGGAAERLVKP